MSVTTDDIKATYSMRDVVERYGLRPNRAGFIQCPFHQGDRTASLKIYKDNFHCYGCGADGDIFKFVMLMENCDFKTAFRQLGGEYSGNGLSDAAVLRIKKRQIERDEKERIVKQAKEKYIQACDKMKAKAQEVESYEPMSDEWCSGKNDLEKLQAAADDALAQLLDLQRHESG
jgi:DNA primase